VHPIECETCVALANRLREVTHRLVENSQRMRSLIDEKPEDFVEALRESERLRTEAQTVRVDLERHTAQHREIKPS
jgi:hypothetical protein